MAEPQNQFQLNGILLIDKPEGPSSARVVQKVKNILGARKVGHLGTLDPFASGLLPLGINEATKIAQVFLSAQKAYSGVIALGAETDTQDCTGKVLKSRDVPPLASKALDELQVAFTGTLRQTPPMFSALRKSGVRLYELARQGQNVPRPAREIKVEKLTLRQVSSMEIRFEVLCSKGTYLRTLATDMGNFLGCGAHLKTLRRLSCGHLTVDQAVPMDEIERLQKRNEVPLISLNQALGHFRQVCFDDGALSNLRTGQQEVLEELAPPVEGEKLIRVVDSRGHLVALAEWADITGYGRWRLFRVFSS